MILRWLRRPESRALLTAVLANEPDKVEGLLKQGIYLLGSDWPGKFTALHLAAISNCWQALPALLKAATKEGLSINCILDAPDFSEAFAELLRALSIQLVDVPYGNNNLGLEGEGFQHDAGMTPLHLACRLGRLEMIPILLKHGASAAVTSNSFTKENHCRLTDALGHLLHQNETSGLLPAVKLLLDHGADPLSRPYTWQYPLVAHQEISLDVRRCLVSFIGEEDQSGAASASKARTMAAAWNWKWEEDFMWSLQAAALCVAKVALPYTADDHRGTLVKSIDPLAEFLDRVRRLPRLVRIVLQQPAAWSTANHRDFPPAFQAAACTFLLVAAACRQHRLQHQEELGGQASAGVRAAGCGLGDVPAPLLERVLGLAAYPLSAWLF
ncbi:hypothetical protein N2152v2_000761 [Parachlorella kessleri]